jgi:hypothetical protein
VSGTRYTVPYAYAPDPNAPGNPVNGALLYFFLGVSATPANTYSDAALTIPNTNPVVADASGTFPTIFLDPSITYTARLTYSLNPNLTTTPGVQIWSAYPVNAAGGSTGSANSYAATGVNAIVLTPENGTPPIGSYLNYQEFRFQAPATSTGTVTVQVTGLGILPLYLGVSQVAASQITAGQFIDASYVASVNNSGIPGMVMLPTTPFIPVVSSADVGAANVYAMNPAQAISAYSSSQLFLLPAINTNTTGSTLNVSGKGALPIQNQGGSPIGPGAIVAANNYVLACTGTAFVLLNPSTPRGPTMVSNLVGSAPGGASSATFTADDIVVTDPFGNQTSIAAFNQTVALTIAGAGGLDTGAVAANTWYAVHAVYGASGVNSVASLSRATPTIPAGFSYFGFIGWVRTDAGSHIRAFTQDGPDAQWVNTGTGLQQMAVGVTANQTTPVLAVPIGAYCPPGASKIVLSAFRSGNNSVGVAPNGNYGILTSASNPPPVIVAANAGSTLAWSGSFVLESTNIYWCSGDAPNALYALGYRINF